MQAMKVEALILRYYWFVVLPRMSSDLIIQKTEFKFLVRSRVIHAFLRISWLLIGFPPFILTDTRGCEIQQMTSRDVA
jgi:hypothetical protein